MPLSSFIYSIILSIILPKYSNIVESLLINTFTESPSLRSPSISFISQPVSSRQCLTG